MCAQVNMIQPSFLKVIPAACHPHPNSLRAFAALVLLAAAPSRVNPYQIHNSLQCALKGVMPPDEERCRGTSHCRYNSQPSPVLFSRSACLASICLGLCSSHHIYSTISFSSNSSCLVPAFLPKTGFGINLGPPVQTNILRISIPANFNQIRLHNLPCISPTIHADDPDVSQPSISLRTVSGHAKPQLPAEVIDLWHILGRSANCVGDFQVSLFRVNIYNITKAHGQFARFLLCPHLLCCADVRVRLWLRIQFMGHVYATCLPVKGMDVTRLPLLLGIVPTVHMVCQDASHQH